MPDVTLLDVKVPVDFYRALSPIRAAGVLEEERLTQRMKDALKTFMQEVARDALAESRLHVRTGTLRDSLRRGLVVWGDLTVNSIRAFFVVPDYVAAQDQGATIHPRQAKVLCVPLPAALRPDGSPKRRYPALWKPLGTFSYQSRTTGKGYLAYRDPRGGLVLLYAYVDVVTLPARLGLTLKYRTLLPTLISMWEGILADEVQIASGAALAQIARAVE